MSSTFPIERLTPELFLPDSHPPSPRLENGKCHASAYFRRETVHEDFANPELSEKLTMERIAMPLSFECRKKTARALIKHGEACLYDPAPGK